MKYNRVIDSIEELRTEVSLQLGQDRLSNGLEIHFVMGLLHDPCGTKIGSHQNKCIAKIYSPALRVCQSTILQNL